jgi:hypothetical protein
MLARNKHVDFSILFKTKLVLKLHSAPNTLFARKKLKVSYDTVHYLRDLLLIIYRKGLLWFLRPLF